MKSLRLNQNYESMGSETSDNNNEDQECKGLRVVNLSNVFNCRKKPNVHNKNNRFSFNNIVLTGIKQNSIQIWYSNAQNVLNYVLW